MIIKLRTRCYIKDVYLETLNILNNNLPEDAVTAIYKRVLLKQTIEAEKNELTEFVKGLLPKSNELKTEVNISYCMQQNRHGFLAKIMTKADFTRLVVHYIHCKQVIF